MSRDRILRAVPMRVAGGPSLAARRPEADSAPRPALLAELATPSERRQVAHEAGWEAGYEAGRQAAEREVAARLEEAAALVEQRRRQLGGLTAALEQAVDELRSATARRSQDLFAGMADAACQLAGAVLDRELRSDPHAVLDAVTRALAAAPEGPATARVHPEDLPAVREAWAGSARLSFEADPAVAPGGCVLQAAAATVDATVAAALTRARAALQGERA